jgi:hypothetical protein
MFLLKDTKGAVSVEFVLIIPFVLVMLLFLIEISRYFLFLNEASVLVNEAARYASLFDENLGRYLTSAEAIDKALNLAYFLDPDDVSLVISYEPDNNVGSFVDARITANYNFLYDIFSTDLLNIDQASSQVIQ